MHIGRTERIDCLARLCDYARLTPTPTHTHDYSLWALTTIMWPIICVIQLCYDVPRWSDKVCCNTIKPFSEVIGVTVNEAKKWQRSADMYHTRRAPHNAFDANDVLKWKLEEEENGANERRSYNNLWKIIINNNRLICNYMEFHCATAPRNLHRKVDELR